MAACICVYLRVFFCVMRVFACIFPVLYFAMCFTKSVRTPTAPFCFLGNRLALLNRCASDLSSVTLSASCLYSSLQVCDRISPYVVVLAQAWLIVGILCITLPWAAGVSSRSRTWTVACKGQRLQFVCFLFGCCYYNEHPRQPHT